MTEITVIRKRAAARLDIVQLYLMRYTDPEMFARLYNAGDISQQLLEESGPITAAEIARWAGICMEVGHDY